MTWNAHRFLLLSIAIGTALFVAPVHAMFANDDDGDDGGASASRPRVEEVVIRVSTKNVRKKFEALQATDPSAGLMVRTLIQSMEDGRYVARIQDPAYQSIAALETLWRSQKKKTISFEDARQKALQFFKDINSRTVAENFVAKLQELNQELAADKQIDTSFAMVETTVPVVEAASSSAAFYPNVTRSVMAEQQSQVVTTSSAASTAPVQTWADIEAKVSREADVDLEDFAGIIQASKPIDRSVLPPSVAQIFPSGTLFHVKQGNVDVYLRAPLGKFPPLYGRMDRSLRVLSQVNGLVVLSHEFGNVQVCAIRAANPASDSNQLSCNLRAPHPELMDPQAVQAFKAQREGRLIEIRDGMAPLFEKNEFSSSEINNLVALFVEAANESGNRNWVSIVRDLNRLVEDMNTAIDRAGPSGVSEKMKRVGVDLVEALREAFRQLNAHVQAFGGPPAATTVHASSAARSLVIAERASIASRAMAQAQAERRLVEIRDEMQAGLASNKITAELLNTLKRLFVEAYQVSENEAWVPICSALVDLVRHINDAMDAGDAMAQLGAEMLFIQTLQEGLDALNGYVRDFGGPALTSMTQKRLIEIRDALQSLAGREAVPTQELNDNLDLFGEAAYASQDDGLLATAQRLRVLVQQENVAARNLTFAGEVQRALCAAGIVQVLQQGARQLDAYVRAFKA